jgi:DNA invertase Pin-like site-specific DNA recombinase
MIVVWKIDRMSRNLSHLLKVFQDLKEMNVVFYSLKENIDFS